jgi:hypothetical protein
MPNETKQNNASGQESEILAQLLENLPSQTEIEVTVPSKNKFYTLLDPTKGITLRPLTFEDEKDLVSSKSASSDLLNTLLTKCVTNIPVNQILQIDKLFLIMKIREMSYGDDYKASISCPSCNATNRVSFFLSELGVNYLEEDAQDPLEVELPILKKKIKIRRPRVADEQYLLTSEKTLANLWRFVEEIEGHTKKTIISEVVKQLPLRDAHTIINFLGGEEVGINTNVHFICNYCDHSGDMTLPITGDFFTGN